MRGAAGGWRLLDAAGTQLAPRTSASSWHHAARTLGPTTGRAPVQPPALYLGKDDDYDGENSTDRAQRSTRR